MVRGRAILAGVLAAPWIRVAHGQVAHRISLIHFNDFHSRHEAVDSKQLTCATRSCTRLDSGTRQRNQAAEPGSGTRQRGRGSYPQLSAQLGGGGYAVRRDRAMRPYDLGPGSAEIVARAPDKP